MTLFHKTVWILGGSSALGIEIAKRLAPHNQVTLFSRSNPKVPSSIFKKLDFENKEEAQQFFSLLEETPPDILIYNIGIGFYGSFHRLKISDHKRVTKLSVTIPLQVAYAFAKAKRKKSLNGIFLGVSSAAAQVWYPYFCSYSAAKCYLTHLLGSLNQEYLGTGLFFLSFNPGAFHSQFANKASKGTYQHKDAKLVMDVSKVAKAVIRQLKTKKPLVIFNTRFRFLLFFLHLLSKKKQSKVLKQTIQERIPPQIQE